MQNIDDDARTIGINEETWRQFKELHKVEQPEFEEIVAPIDDKEAFIRHKEAMARRWFGYYRKCKDPQKKLKLIDQYNFVATMKQRD